MTEFYNLDEEERAAFAANIAWLEKASPDDWHRVCLDFNWDEPLYILDWIVRQEACDIATAATIFWLGQPTWWLAAARKVEEEPNGFSYLNRKICVYISDRVRGGGYRRSEIEFIPGPVMRRDYAELAEAEKANPLLDIRVHPDLIRQRKGRKVELNADFYRRYPEDFHHSYFDEGFAADLDAGRYETPESTALMRRVAEIDRETLASLPNWLKPEPDWKEVKSKATSLMSDGFVISFPIVALALGTMTRFGSTTGRMIVIGILMLLAYNMWDNYQGLRMTLTASGKRISRKWIAASVPLSLLLGAAAFYPFARLLGSWRETYGMVTVAACGIALVALVYLVVARLVVELLSRWIDIAADEHLVVSKS